MKIKNVFLIGVFSLGMAGCAHHSQGAKANGGNAAAGDGATAYGVGVQGTTGGQLAALDQTYYFGFDDSSLAAATKAAVEKQADYLVHHQNAKVRVEGHTDERGSREYNVALGERRAASVADILRQAGVSEFQIAVVSYGEEKPDVFGHDDQAYAKNRRARIIYEDK